jgi:hypothetical protein
MQVNKTLKIKADLTITVKYINNNNKNAVPRNRKEENPAVLPL